MFYPLNSIFFRLFLPRMKNTGLLSFLFLCLSCSQEKLVIEPEQNPFAVMPSTFKTHVLIENIEGENNSDCVDASVLLGQFKNQYYKQLTLASIHQNDWLEIPYGKDLEEQLGGVVSYPRASIQRMLGENTVNKLDDNFVWLSQLNWYKHLQQAFVHIPPLAISLESSFTNAQFANLHVYIAHKTALPPNARLQVYIVEDNLPAVFQLGANSNYIHQHVVREVISDYKGDPIISLDGENEEGIKKISYTNIPLQGYQLNHIKFVAFIYTYSADFRKKQILNVQEVNIGGNKYWD